MKILRFLTVVIFVIVTCAFSLTFYKVRSGLDRTKPVITIAESKIFVDVNVTEDELLSGVTAYDEKDGDLSKKIVIQDISKFVDDSTSVVTYVVCDSNNNLTKARQKICYTNYTHPKLKLFGPLLFPVSSDVSLRSIVGADDVIDGDISGNVVINSANVDTSKEGIYNASMSVFNSKGDLVSYDLPVRIYTAYSRPNCEIQLTDYLVYKKVGEEINPLDYLTGVVSETGEPLYIQPIIEGFVDTSKPGGYAVYFSIPKETGYTAINALSVIVTE